MGPPEYLRASAMMTTFLRFPRPAAVAALAVLIAVSADVQEKTPFPSLSDKRVYVAGVPDQYQAIADHINRLERSSPQTYYLVVIKSSGRGQSSTLEYAEDLFRDWQSQAARTAPAV